MKLFRRIIFWLHLACGLIAGLVIGVMSFTGAALAFEKEIVAFVERDARRVTPPTPEARPLPLDELTRRIRVARPDYRPSGFVIAHDPHAAIALSAGGRAGGGGFGGGPPAPTLYVNPYTGEVKEGSSPRTQAFMRTMRSWHRWLGLEGDHRSLARAITGACNAAFLGLAVTGLYLWWPRSWSRLGVRAVMLLNFRLRGKARDFNWHNVIGLWSAPVLVVLTATALPMSYTWASDAIYRLTGTPAPTEGGRGPGGGRFDSADVELSQPAEGAPPLSSDALLALVQQQNPSWKEITLRAAGSSGGGGRSGARGGPRAPDATRSSVDQPRPDRPPSGPSAVTITLKQSDSWPRTATTTLTLDPYTGAVLRHTGYAEQNPAQQVRSWTRFLHTGEALGWAGQLVAALASLGGCVLMYTGFALAWRRFFVRRTA
jgi:uncharacterized iron-regulated membrane protein